MPHAIGHFRRRVDESLSLGEGFELPGSAVGEPRFRAGQGVSRQPSNFALALSDFQSGVQPRVLRSRRKALQDELESGRLLGVSIRSRGLTGVRARLLRRKLTAFGTVVNPRGTSRQVISLSPALQSQAFQNEFGSSAGLAQGEFRAGNTGDTFSREFDTGPPSF